MPGPRARIEVVLFDLGGTLVDEADYDGWASLARVVFLDLDADLMRHAYVEVAQEVDRAPIGPRDLAASQVEFWRRVLARAAEREVDTAAAARFVEALAALPPKPLELYSDARRCLERLRAGGVRLGVVSNSRSEANVRRILDRVGILAYFERVVSSGTEGVAKPDPEIFRRAVERMKVDPGSALFVGNLEHTDTLAARRAGLRSVWLNREGTGFSEGTPEITSLLEVPIVVVEIETGRAVDADAASHA